MTEITLDKKTFEALALDSRIDILKALKQRRKTQAELSRELKLSAPTISEHLNKMIKAGLIEKQKQGKKWIYYELTEKGKHIIQPKITTTFAFALSLSIVLMFIGAYSLIFMQSTSFGIAAGIQEDTRLIDNFSENALTAGKTTGELVDEVNGFEAEQENSFGKASSGFLNQEEFDFNFSITLLVAGIAIFLIAIQKYRK